MSHYKPYPAYKDSGVEWLGQVPEGWSVVPLKWLATIQNGKDYKDVETGEGGFPVIGSGGEFARASQYLFNGESVLLGRKGTIDRPLHINGAFWTVDTMYYTVIGPKVVGKYLYYCSLTIQFDRYSTNTALPSMTQEVLGQIPFALPSIEVQREIVAHIDRETARIDGLVSRKTRFIELLSEKRQALITHAVTKGLNPDAPMKDSGVEWLGDVPEHWEVKKLSHISKIVRGASPRPAGDPKFFAGENENGINMPWLTVAEVTKGNDFYVFSTSAYLTPLGVTQSQIFNVGTLVFSNSGATLGVPRILAIECCANDGVLAFKTLSRSVDIKFM